MIQRNQNFVQVNEAFPHIGKAIALFWGHPEFYEFSEGLQHQQDGKRREGFPANILTALFNLTSEHDKMFPELVPKKTDIWIVDGTVR